MLTDRTVTGLLEAFSAADPTPGGGSAAALAGATGAALLAMVAGMPKSRTNAVAERQALGVAAAELLKLRHLLTDLIDRDASAYDLVIAAFRKPKGTDQEKAERRAAIQEATRVATEVPLETIRACVSAIREGRATATHGNSSAASDVKVGYRLLIAAAEGARDNVDINLSGLTDVALQTVIRDEVTTLMNEAAAHGRSVLAV
ncbi:MAG: cyclodeaminase/cyclohydrolase family protein [Acidobacteria bacterium]|jgi:methenyltetrahydrofolate cyclohydrolase|nr:cyclodeaminase/cyclohydrolase family protein [Acidobacteriota bacterium]